jgi:hypothetical protein
VEINLKLKLKLKLSLSCKIYTYGILCYYVAVIQKAEAIDPIKIGMKWARFTNLLEGEGWSYSWDQRNILDEMQHRCVSDVWRMNRHSALYRHLL